MNVLYKKQKMNLIKIFPNTHKIDGVFLSKLLLISIYHVFCKLLLAKINMRDLPVEWDHQVVHIR